MHCQTWDWKWALHGIVEAYTDGSGGKRAAAAAMVLIRQDGEEYLRGPYGYGLDDKAPPPKPKPRPSQVPSAYPTTSKTIMDMDVAFAFSLMHM